MPPPPEWLFDDDEPSTRAVRGTGTPYPPPMHLTEAPSLPAIPSIVRTERSVVQPYRQCRPEPVSVSAPRPAVRKSEPVPSLVPAARRIKTERSSDSPAVAEPRRSEPRRSEPRRSEPRPAESSRKSESHPRESEPRKSESRKSKHSEPSRKSEPATPAAEARPSDPAAAAAAAAAAVAAAVPAAAQQIAAGIGSFDPMQIPVPPELGTPIYGWIRRLALQADLAGADRVLRDALADMTCSLNVSIIYPGQDGGLWTLGNDDEIPRDPKPIVACAQLRRAVIASHTALVPIVTSSETVGVVVLTRNPRNPAYHPIEQIAMVALAREAAAILHHLAVQHIQHDNEIKADKGSLYRGEALEAHRTRGNEGAPIQLTPGWVKRTYPILCISLVIAVFASIFVQVPTYSSGRAIVTVDGELHTAPAAGTIDKVLVKANQSVKKGTPLIRLHSASEDAEYQRAKSDLDKLKVQYLFDPQDEQVKKTLTTAVTAFEREERRLAQRTVIANKDGTVLDIRSTAGALVQPGDPLLRVVDAGAEYEMVAFLPASDRPRLRPGQKLQVGIDGYTKTRELATITFVDNAVVGGSDVLKAYGPVVEPLKLQGGSFVIVKAKLPSRTFKTQHKKHHYYFGMTAKTEVKIQSKPFLVTLLPALEKYIPD